MYVLDIGKTEVTIKKCMLLGIAILSLYYITYLLLHNKTTVYILFILHVALLHIRYANYLCLIVTSCTGSRVLRGNCPLPFCSSQTSLFLFQKEGTGG